MSCVQRSAEIEAIVEPPIERLDHAVGEPSVRSALVPPTILCVVMVLVGWITSQLANVSILGLFLPYLTTGAAFTFSTVLIFIFVEVAKLASLLADRPIAIVAKRLWDRLPQLLFAAIVFPLFFAGFTAAKTSIPYLAHYSWDPIFARADVWIFGDDAWRIAYRAVGTKPFRLLELLYTVGWGFALAGSASAVALYASKRTVGIFNTAMFATWLIGGCFLAYVFSSAGPVFASAFDPSLHRFDPIRTFVANASTGGSVDHTQRYLMTAVFSHVAVKGGGISAMPSMHLGAAAIYVIAARGTRLMIPAIIFWLGIFFCSAYFGYHYWVDGIAGALVACFCWFLASTLYPARTSGASVSITDP